MFPILTTVGGLVTASPLIIARKPNSKELFAWIAPYQGFLGLGMLALVVPRGRFEQDSLGFLWGDFFAKASFVELCDIGFCRLVASSRSEIEHELPAHAAPLPPDPFLACYPPGERVPDVVQVRELPAPCLLGQPGNELLPLRNRALARVLADLIHPQRRTVRERRAVFEERLRLEPEPSPLLERWSRAFREREAAESEDVGAERRHLLSRAGRLTAPELRHDPVEGGEWTRVSQHVPVDPRACGPCGVSASTRTSRRFLRFYAARYSAAPSDD